MTTVATDNFNNNTGSINDSCFDHNVKNMICSEPIISPLHHMFPCSWNHKLSNQLPRLDIPEETKVFFSNVLFFIILIESIPTAYKIIKTWRSGNLEDEDDNFYELKLHFIVSFLTSWYVLFYGIIISNFLLIYSSMINIILQLIYLYVVFRVIS